MSTSTSVTIKRKAKDGVSYCIDTAVESVVLTSEGKFNPQSLNFQCYIVTGGTRELYSGLVGMLFYNKSMSLNSYNSSGLTSCYAMNNIIPNNTAFIECVFFSSKEYYPVDMYAYKKQGNSGDCPIPLCSKTIPVIKEGGEGGVGPAGPTLRPCGMWKSGTTLVNNDDYIDVVCIANSNGEAVFYKLKDAYSSNSGFTTSNPSSDTTHYERADNLGFVASAVLLGKTGYINVLGSAKILVSNDGTNGWQLTNGKIRHTVTGVELTEDGYIKDPNGLHFKVGDIASNAILQPNANLFPDPIFQFGMPFTKVAGTGVQNSTMTGYVDVLGVIGDYFNYFSPWQADGGQIMRMGIISNSYGADVNMYAYTNAPTGDWRIKLIAGKTYTFSIWVKLSGDVMTNIAPNALLAEVNFWADETTVSDRASQIHISINNKCGSVGGFTQYYVTFVVPTGHEYFTWMPLVTIAKNKYNFYISYAACKLEMSDVPSELNYNAGNAITRKLLQTGIDIEGNEILMTADNFKLQNNSGKETFYVDEYGNACLAGYLSENTNVIRSLDDFLSTFIPCNNIVDIDSTPGTESVTYYDNGSSVSVRGAKVFTSMNGWPCGATVNGSVSHGYTVSTSRTICAMLDMRCASGIISLDWSPKDGSNVLPMLLVLPYMGVLSSFSCYGVHLNSSALYNGVYQSDLALTLKPNYNYSGSNVFTDPEASASFNGYTTNTNIHHNSQAGITKVNGVVCNTVVPPDYSLYFNLRGNVMAGASSIDNNSFRYAANVMVWTNNKGANRFMKSATVYYYWVKKDGTKTSPLTFAQLVNNGSTMVNNSNKTIKVTETYKDLYAFVRLVVGPNRDNSTSSETYDTNHTLFCSYATYDMEFVRTLTTMNKFGRHYINYQELLSLVGHRFVLMNNTGADVFVINRADLGSGQFNTYDTDPGNQTCPMIKIPIDTTMGFTLVCEDYMYSKSISGFDVRYPIFYWKPDEKYNGMLKNSDLSTDVWGGEIYLD